MDERMMSTLLARDGKSQGMKLKRILQLHSLNYLFKAKERNIKEEQSELQSGYLNKKERGRFQARKERK